MTALACLRVVVAAADLEIEGRRLENLVLKYTEAYLDARWRPPRHHDSMGPTSYLLVDPEVEEIPAEELKSLGLDLTTRLFGDSRIGEVRVLALQGRAEDIEAFSALPPILLADQAALAAAAPELAARLLDVGPAPAPSRGTPIPVRSERPPGLAAPAALAARIGPQIDQDRTTFRGVYFAPASTFYGSLLMPFVAAWKRKYSRRTFATFPPQELSMEFDRVSLTAAVEALQSRPPPGVLFIPISFAAAVTRMRLVRLRPFLDRLLPFDRTRLGATLYGVEPSPPFDTVRVAIDNLHDYFGVVDLKTSYTDFPCHTMLSPCARGVTFVPDGVTGFQRLNQIRAFLQRLAEFRSARVWTAVGDVQTAEELQLCVDMRAPFLSGPAVTPALATGAPLLTVALRSLPLGAA